MSFPQTVLFTVRDAQQEVRYLSLTGPQRQLRFGNEEGVFSDTVQFTVEQAGSGLVHIRSLFTNNYWVRASRSEPWLVASSREKVEDISRDDCTMFRPQFSPGNVFVSFVHAQSGFNVVMLPETDAHAYNLSVEPAAPTDFSFIDYSPLRRSKLPRYIMFLGDNNRYLSARSSSNATTLDFQTFQNPTDQSVGFEVEYTKSGDSRFKSMRFDGFWGATSNAHVVLLNNTNPNDPNTVFEVSRSAPAGIGFVGVGLRNRGRNQFCFRQPSNSILAVGRDTASTPEACLRPRHAADQNSRKVNVESFRDARSSKSILYLRMRVLINSTNVEREHLLVEPTNTLFTRTTFSNSVSYFEGPQAMFSGQIPSVATSGELEFPNTAVNVQAFWGGTKRTSVNKRLEDRVILPAKTRVEITIYKNVATYEVPFSYQQSDRFPFGGPVTQDLHDGNIRIVSEHDLYAAIRNVVPVRSAEEIPESAVELVPGSGIFEYEGSAEQDGVETDAPDQETDAIGDMRPDASEKQADALVGNKTDATDQLIPEV